MVKKGFVNIAKAGAWVGLVLAIAVVAGSAEVRQGGASDDAQETMATSVSAFRCNMGVFSAAERKSHERLTQRLIAMRRQIVETEKGYEFQFDPAVVSIGQLAEWAVAESKCCSFFDFHIDLEERGTLACLRLTGAPGIKSIIREEFRVPSS